MSLVVSGSVGVGLPGSNALIADANQSETINFNGVFCAIPRPGASRAPEMVCRAKQDENVTNGVHLSILKDSPSIRDA